jgi:hypothetical protein
MGFPPRSRLPIQLLPQVPRAFSISSAGLSLSLHGGLLALAVAGTGHWLTSQPAPIPKPQATLGAVTYVAVLPSAHPPSRPSGGAAPRIGRPGTPSESRHPRPRPPPPPRPAVLTLPVLVPRLVLRTGAIESVNEDKLDPDDVLASAGAGRGTSRVAELLTNPGAACPELRRPTHLDSAVDLEVAVTFVVDSLGAVDRTTLRVVEAPGRPAVAPGFIPHIYAVGGTARVDRNLPEALPQYGAIVADDVLRHVASLRFRPGTRNGRPTRSAVLVACRAQRLGH